MAETPLADAMVLFGATGDLSRRMVIPSLYFLDADGFLPPGFKVLATARAALSRDEFVAQALGILQARAEGVDEAVWSRFSARLDYVSCDATSADGLAGLASHLDGHTRPMFFLAVSPSLYGRICVALARSTEHTSEL